ncbi:hypothetical protein BSFA1_80750 (plasmid) [Burkholderia sp. SFA1]|nr:hypothetical protein BYI23_E001680 [Burkholderia sp. YI23]BBQ02947.1 hypothetical protein BSFA1_80750 [Burkholderia sp. SFA1]
MKIASRLKDQSTYPETFVVLDTTTPIGKFSVSLGVGGIEGKNLFLTEVGQCAYRRLTETSASKLAKIRLVEVVTGFKAKKLVPDTFMRATDGDSIFFVCKDSAVYDSVYSLLAVATDIAVPA